MTNEAYDNTTTLDPRIAQRLKHDDKGLVAAVIQQFDTKEVLMVGYMNDEAIRRTLTTGRVTFWSRVVVLSYASLVMMVLRFVVQYYRVGLRSFRGSIQRTVYPAALMASLTSPMVTLP